MSTLSISFDGYFLCRLATDPDPSTEQRGISGFTFAVAGETLLEPTIWTQASDVLKNYGLKEDAFRDDTSSNPNFTIKNIREASPDYVNYNERGIGILVKEVRKDGIVHEQLTEKMKGAKCRLLNRKESNGPWKGPIFEGRNQITSDGDPDRFTVNPFVFSINTADDSQTLLTRFDPLDAANPDKKLFEIFPNEVVNRRLPYQRFAMSNEGLNEIGIAPDDLGNYFVNRMNWLKSKIVEAEASDKPALAAAYQSRLYAVNFFTQATGPTVLQNRLLSRIPLRQLYRHSLRGNENISPQPVVLQEFFDGNKIDVKKDWEIIYYLGQYDGDLMAGWCSGILTLPLVEG